MSEVKTRDSVTTHFEHVDRQAAKLCDCEVAAPICPTLLARCCIMGLELCHVVRRLRARVIPPLSQVCISLSYNARQGTTQGNEIVAS